MAEKRIKILLTPAGTAWESTREYKMLDYIADGTTLYVCVKTDAETGVNVGHALTETAWWNKCLDMSEARDAALKAADKATNAATDAAKKMAEAVKAADKATEAANTAATGANAAATSAKAAASAATDAAATAKTAADNATAATTAAEKVNATITDGNAVEVTDRTGAKKTLQLASQTEVAEAVAEVSSLKKAVERTNQSFGHYTERPSITLSAKEANVAISADGVKVRKQGWAIAEFTAELGNEYLFKPGETDGDVCVFAELIDKVETRAIDYQTTYDEQGRVATATATYNGKTYTYMYDYSGNEVVITDQSGQKVTQLPSVYTTAVGSYSVLTRLNADAELPEDGYCRFVSNFQRASAITVVVSYKVGAADLTMLVMRDGLTANMCTQLSKINKKVDDVTAAQKKKNSVLIMAIADGVKVKIDDVIYDVPAKRRFYKEGFVSCHVTAGRDKINRFDANYDVGDANGTYYFESWKYLTSLDISRWDTSKMTDMRMMFRNTSLKHLDVSHFDTSNVRNMNEMFTTLFGYYRNSLESLDVSGWDTGNVTSMASMFAYCSSLESLDVSGWDTGNVTSMASMFAYCSSLESLDVSGWDTGNVTSMASMFAYCISLATLTFGEGFGKMQDSCGTLDLSALSAWKNSSVNSLLNLYDRKANGMGVITIKLHAAAKAALGEDGIAQLTAKGYTIA